MLKVGITGGIGAGKTTVCRLFESYGIPVYYADIEAKRLMYRSTDLKRQIKELLGPESYHRNGRLHRGYVASRVFGDKQLLTQLNDLVHPAVEADSLSWMERQDPSLPYALYEAALLVENGSYKRYDRLISVSAPEHIRIQRVMQRDGISADQVRARLRNQLPQADKDAVADYVIVNEDMDRLEVQVHQIHTELSMQRNTK